MWTESWRGSSSKHRLAAAAGLLVAFVFGSCVANFGVKQTAVFILSAVIGALLFPAVSHGKRRTLAAAILAFGWAGAFFLLDSMMAQSAVPLLVGSLLGLGYGVSLEIALPNGAPGRQQRRSRRVLIQLTGGGIAAVFGYGATTLDLGLDEALVPGGVAVTSLMMLVGAYRLRSRGMALFLLACLSGAAGLVISGFTLSGFGGPIKWIAFAVFGASLAGVAWLQSTENQRS